MVREGGAPPQALAQLVERYNRGDLRAVVRGGTALAAACPREITLLNLLGAAHAGLGEAAAAVAWFRKAAGLRPDLAQSHANLGLALQAAGDDRAAAASFRQALAIGPADPGVLNNLGAVLARLGDGEGAIASYERALELAPGYAMAAANLGIALKDAGRMEAAVAAFERAVAADPRDAESLCNLAAALHETGRPRDAAARYRAALAVRPRNADALKGLGVVLKALGETAEAETCLEAALAARPGDADVLNALGLLLHEAGRRRAAIERFQAATAAKPDDAAAWNNLGLVLSELGELDAAIEALEKAIAIRPSYPGANVNLVNVRNRRVPAWHVGMMNDHARNRAFADALAATLEGGELVLEVGTGSGLLAMMAADRGADRVVTCEAVAPVAEIAGRIVAGNGFAERVTVLNRRSTELSIPDDLPRKADVVVAEILSSEFVGEGVVASLRDARRRLLREGGHMIPSGGAIMIALLSDAAEAARSLHVGEVEGYDLSAFNGIAARKVDLRLDRPTPTLLSDPVAAFDFDFLDPRAFNGRRETFALTAKRDGTALGVIQWNRARLAEAVVYENHPERLVSHWSTPVYLFDRPLPLRAGQTVAVEGELSEDSVWFRRADEGR